jgi:hypothetical protein
MTHNSDPDVPHGTGLICEDPVEEFNKLLTAVEPPVEFLPLGEPVSDVEVDGQQVSLRDLCGLQKVRVVAVGRLGKTVAIYTVTEDADLRLRACTPEEEDFERECYESGGTCVHDVLCVPQATVWPSGTIVRMTLK